ncbi:Protein F10E7.9 [Aphelenchoides avenae]|nr:Protein F10E7.9 [Aphelenchus avenae]
MAGGIVIDQVDPEDSLFSQEQSRAGGTDVPWWQRNFLLRQRTLIGTWDGVFPTVMVNIFGIVVFIRMGWIVGTAGVSHAVLLLILSTIFCLITVFSAIGICERCKLQSGGIYFLISHVLGGQIGGTVGLLYVFGQATATGLVAYGFGESMARLFRSDNEAAIKLIAVSVLIVLTGLNTVGLRFVIRLQLLLLCVLAAAVFDFFLGSLFIRQSEVVIGPYSSERLSANMEPHYVPMNCTVDSTTFETKHESFFSVFGVLFANFLGVLAGVNMSGDLKEPKKNIPQGELSAIAVSSGVCFLMILALGAIVERPSLLCDYMISERISMTKVLFLSGIYVSSLSSIVGSMLGPPRVLQGIAAEGLIPAMGFLAKGEGPNDTPVRASVVLSAVAVVFILLGNLNQLAILSTTPFLITYAYVNYAYVSLAMSNDLEALNDQLHTIETSKSYGSMADIKNGQGKADTPSASSSKHALDELFATERTRDTARLVDDNEVSSWYFKFTNRYVSLVGAILNFVFVLFINQWYAFLHLLAFLLIYLYIGSKSPAIEQGVSSFSLFHMGRTIWTKAEWLGEIKGPSFIVKATGLDVNYETTRLNDDNEDYSARKQYHHAEEVRDFD